VVGGEPKQMPRTHLVQIEDDELAGEGEQGDEEHDLRLDNALLSRHDVLESVVELEGDQERHDLPEQRLKGPRIQGVEDTNSSPAITLAVKRYNATRMINPMTSVRTKATKLSKRW
jgi:hypothetical protein